MSNKFICALFSMLSTTLTLSGGLVDDLDGMQQLDCYIMPLSDSEIGGVLHKGPYSCQKQESQLASTFTHIPLDASTSLNWSGYAALTSLKKPKTGSVSQVYGSWTAPSLLGTPGTSYAAIWCGIDGYVSQTVEQIGSLHIWNNGFQHDFAWFELFPRGLYEIVGFPVNPGDVLASQVSFVRKNTFQLIIINYTQSVYFIVPEFYTKIKNAKRSSAEWIIEAPSSLSQVLPLANFGTVIFTDCKATIKSVTGSIDNCHWEHDPITMATATTPRINKAVPSILFNEGSSFAIDWFHE